MTNIDLRIHEEADAPDAGTSPIDLPKLKAIIHTIIASLSRIEGTPRQPFAEDCIVYYRRALARLDRYDVSRAAELNELSKLVREIKEVSAACLLLMQQRNMTRSVVSLPVPRKIGIVAVSNAHLN